MIINKIIATVAYQIYLINFETVGALQQWHTFYRNRLNKFLYTVTPPKSSAKSLSLAENLYNQVRTRATKATHFYYSARARVH